MMIRSSYRSYGGGGYQVQSSSIDSQGNQPSSQDRSSVGSTRWNRVILTTNAKATLNIWAKKCDGFISFSTVEDPSFASVNILNEGDKSYDNIHASLSGSTFIHKYIHTHIHPCLPGGSSITSMSSSVWFLLTGRWWHDVCGGEATCLPWIRGDHS